MRSVGTGSTYYRIPAESTFVGSMHFLCNLLKCSCGSVVEHCVSSAKGCGFDSQEKHILMKKCIAWMHCKSLWIKASAKCINVKPRTVHFRQEEPASPAFIVRNRPIRLDMTLWQSVYCFVYSVVHRSRPKFTDSVLTEAAEWHKVSLTSDLLTCDSKATA